MNNTVLILMSAFFVLSHLAFAWRALADLLTKSQRELKFTWFVLILLLPFLGAILYHKTKKRRRIQYWG